ncbi:MAG: hypothetical protein Kow0089_21420 [Desulfobulbaceae bacterium]
MYPVTPYPINDLEGELLVSAGTELSPQFMEGLCRSNRKEHEVVPLLKYGTVLQDLMRQFTVPPYDVIFSQERASLTALDIMERVRLPVPLLEALDFFRENDFHTYRHMLIISALSSLILQELDPGYMLAHREEPIHLGPVHDIGKITVPVEILLKKTPLTHGELDLLKNHTLAGYVLLCYYLRDPQSYSGLIARDHHERRDGSGYPEGIRQTNLIIEITTVCDIYDALVAQRPYRQVSFDNRSAIEELTDMARKGEIGWEPVKVLIAYNREGRPDPLDIQVSLERRGKPPENNVYRKFAD